MSQHLQQEERDLAMALSQAFLEWEQKTEQRGLQEGLQQGLQQGQFTVILNLLTHKFGELAPTIRSQVEALSLSQLEALSIRLLDFTSLGELGEWLDHNPPEG